VENGAQLAIEAHCNMVISLGGGSVIDTGKAIAGLATNGAPLRDYLEGVGTGKEVTQPTLPFIAIPTSSGTGAEVTRNAVICSRTEGWKRSFRHEMLYAKVALIDPELTLGLPSVQTAASGMDALTQLMEAYISKKQNPMCDGMALEGMRLAAWALPAAFEDGNYMEAREAMALASLMSGLCLANGGLGADHGIAASLGGNLGIPHGLACAILLSPVMAFNAQSNPAKFTQMAYALTGKQVAPVEAGNVVAAFVKALATRLHIPSDLKASHIDNAMLDKLANDSMGSSMSGNPIPMDIAATKAFLQALI